MRAGVGRTGVLAELGPQRRPQVGLRVDMDALPVEERTGLADASLRQGVMHACGHDIHSCIGLGVARLLAQESSLPVGIGLLFLPSEGLAQGVGWMRADGAAAGLSALFGVHVFPTLPVATIGVRSGSLTGGAGEL